jgi:hypothetical protein
MSDGKNKGIPFPEELIPTANAKELAQANEELKGVLPELFEFHKIMAKIRKNKYDELLSVGFTEMQAIEICKTALII